MRAARAGAVVAWAIAGSAAAGPWVRERGQTYLEVAAPRLATTRLAAPDGSAHEVPEIEIRRLSLHAELGLGAGLAAVVSIPLVHDTRIAGFGGAAGLGDVTAGVEIGVVQRGPWRAALRAALSAPTGDESLGESLLPSGSGVWEQESAILLGHSLAGGWLVLEAGHRIRGGGFQDALAWGAELGRSLGSRATVAVTLAGLEPYRNTGIGLATGSGLGNGTSWMAAGVKASLGLGGPLAAIAAVERSFAGRNLAVGWTLRAGMSLRR